MPQRAVETRLFRLAGVLLTLGSWLSGCKSQTVVFSVDSEALDAGARDAAAGFAVDAATGERVYGCRSAAGGGPAIVTEIVARLNRDFFSQEHRCSTDADCPETFITPACNDSTATCVPCPDGMQQVAFWIGLGACLTTAAATCCRDPEAPPDCIVRACSIGCGAR